jgi:hypothetical protein
LRLLVAAIAACLVLALAPAAAARPAVYDLTIWGGDNDTLVKHQSPIDCRYGTVPEEDCVVNPLNDKTGANCFWDVDDVGNGSSYGRLFAGTTSVSRCGIFDTRYLFIGVRILTTRPDLTVTLAYEPGLTFTLGPAPYVDPEGRWQWQYRGCVQGPIYQRTTADLATDPIPDSHGGWGVISTVTLTVTSPADQKSNQTTSGGAAHGPVASSNEAKYCANGVGDPTDSVTGPGHGRYLYSINP